MSARFSVVRHRDRGLSILIAAALVGCGPSPEEIEAVGYTPLPGDGWEVSTPAEQGLAPVLVAELYPKAAELERLVGLLVVKNGHQVIEFARRRLLKAIIYETYGLLDGLQRKEGDRPILLEVGLGL